MNTMLFAVGAWIVSLGIVAAVLKWGPKPEDVEAAVRENEAAVASKKPRKRGFRKIGVLALGTLLLLIGAALMVLPGPGIPLVMAGLALWATEFTWAATLYRKARVKWRGAMKQLGQQVEQSGDPDGDRH